MVAANRFASKNRDWACHAGMNEMIADITGDFMILSGIGFRHLPRIGKALTSGPSPG